MRTEVAILHNDYPSQVRELVEEKLQGLLKFHSKTVSVRALLERQKEDHRVELVANVGHGTVLVADALESAFSGALDEAVSRMQTLLKKHNSKRTSRRRTDRR